MWKWAEAVRRWAREGLTERPPVRIGLALGGGFARSLAHVGLLQVFQERGIPIHSLAGISSGAMIAAAFASGTPLDQIISAGACTSFSSYARWTLSKVGLATNDRMDLYLRKLLRATRFEQMRTPLAVVATDLGTGAAVVYKDRGDVIAPVRASCAYPGLFLPVEIDGRWLVDGAIAANVPVDAAAGMGATHVIAVHLHTVPEIADRPANIFQVVNRCFAIMQDRMVTDWRQKARLVVEPDVGDFTWDDFGRAPQLVEAGRRAALAALPKIQSWLRGAAIHARLSSPRLAAVATFPMPEKPGS